MECAKELLCTTNYKIKDVASEAGFNDYHYFSKTFKKLNDCSPADYRRGTQPVTFRKKGFLKKDTKNSTFSGDQKTAYEMTTKLKKNFRFKP